MNKITFANSIAAPFASTTLNLSKNDFSFLCVFNSLGKSGYFNRSLFCHFLMALRVWEMGFLI